MFGKRQPEDIYSIREVDVVKFEGHIVPLIIGDMELPASDECNPFEIALQNFTGAKEYMTDGEYLYLIEQFQERFPHEFEAYEQMDVDELLAEQNERIEKMDIARRAAWKSHMAESYFEGLGGIEAIEDKVGHVVGNTEFDVRPMLFDYMAEHFTPEEWWITFGDVYLYLEPDEECQNTHWIQEMMDKAPECVDYRRCLMSEVERKQFDALPDTLTIHRGTIYPDTPGWGWTLDTEKAKSMAIASHAGAESSNDTPHMLTGTIAKKDVIGYFPRSPGVNFFCEAEIFCDSEHVAVVERINLLAPEED